MLGIKPSTEYDESSDSGVNHWGFTLLIMDEATSEAMMTIRERPARRPERRFAAWSDCIPARPETPSPD